MNYTRKAAFSVLLGTIFLFCTPIASAASKTVVRGNVYDESNGGKGIGGLTVTVTCQGKDKTITKTDTTDNFGLYTVNFNGEKCDEFDSVISAVTFKGQTQTETTQVSSQDRATIDFYFGSASVPEFSILVESITFIGSISAFLILRKANFLDRNLPKKPVDKPEYGDIMR